MTITQQDEYINATRQLIYILLEHGQEAISLYTAEDLSSWLCNIVVPTKNYDLIYELSRAALVAGLFNSYVLRAFIESCKYLNKLEDLSLIQRLPKKVL